MTAQKPTSSLPARKPKATARKSKPAANPFRSAEFVEDSDLSEGAATEASKKKKESKITTSAPVTSKPAPPKAKTSTSTSKPSQKRKSSSPSPAKESSSGSSDDSGSEASSSSQEGSPSPIQPKQSAVQSNEPKPLQKPSVEKVQLSKSKVNGTVLTRENSSQNKSEGDGESSGSGSESESGSSDQTSPHSQRKRSPIRKPTSNNAVVSYEPPSGFEASSIAIHPSSKAAELFLPANLVGKEIWHITAPASVPIGLIKEVPTQSIQSRVSNVSYEGADYGLVPEIGAEAASNRALLLPSTQTNDYRISESTIIKTLHLQQLINLPIHNSLPAKSSSQNAAVPETQEKAPRQQPEGLRMRYHPFGASDDSGSEVLPENAAKAPQFRVPTPVDASLAKKRKRAEIDRAIPSMDVSPAKSSSKKRKVHGDADAIGPDTAMDVDVIKTETLQVNSPKEKSARLPNGVTLDAHRPNGIQPENAKTKRIKEKHKHKQPEPPPVPMSALPTQIIKEAETIIPEEVVNGASALEITHSQDKKARRREERRKMKEAANAAEQESHGEADGKLDSVMTDVAHHSSHGDDDQNARAQSREESARPLTPEHSSPQKHHPLANDGSFSIQTSHQISLSKETKEERAKRKEEKRRKREAMHSA